METRFDLNAAIESWRNELAAQPDLASDDRRELETHLRDAVTGFQQRGLNDEESFWLARRRVGQPQQIGEEFVKVDPAAIWRERVFWMILALFLSVTWGKGIASLTYVFWPTTHGIPALIIYSITMLIPLAAAVLLGYGKMVRPFSKLTQLVKDRRRLLIAVIVTIAISATCYAIGQQHLASVVHGPSLSVWQNLILFSMYPLVIAIALTWLMPPQNRKTPKRA
jgi:hypothetical protein